MKQIYIAPEAQKLILCDEDLMDETLPPINLSNTVNDDTKDNTDDSGVFAKGHNIGNDDWGTLPSNTWEWE